MGEYLAQMKEFSENLALASEPISNDYLISSVLAGLDSEFLPIMCQINSQGPMSWQEFHSNLVTFENTLLRLKVISLDGDTSVNFAATNHHNNTRASHLSQERNSGRNNTSPNNIR